MKGFSIVKANEALKPRPLFVVLFGLPGVGKTSLSFTFDKPALHWDFDRGINRAFQAYRPDSFQVDEYGRFIDYVMSQEFEDYVKEEGYQTVVMDTIGTLLDDYIAPWLIRSNPKNGTSGGLSLQGWGQLSNAFNLLRNRLIELGLEIIAICHGKEEGEDKQYRLAVKGGTTDIIYRSSDMIGFMYVQGERRFIDFNPTQSHIGKNTARLPKLEIPDGEVKAADYLIFGENISRTCKERMVEESIAQTVVKAKVAEYKESIEEAKKPADFDAIIFTISEEVNKIVKVQAKKLLGAALKDNNFTYDKESEKVVKIKKEPQEQPEAAKEASKEEANANA